jgi:hypothetical protein
MTCVPCFSCPSVALKAGTFVLNGERTRGMLEGPSGVLVVGAGLIVTRWLRILAYTGPKRQ